MSTGDPRDEFCYPTLTLMIDSYIMLLAPLDTPAMVFKEKIHTFFKCIYYRAYSITEKSII